MKSIAALAFSFAWLQAHATALEVYFVDQVEAAIRMSAPQSQSLQALQGKFVILNVASGDAGGVHPVKGHPGLTVTCADLDKPVTAIVGKIQSVEKQPALASTAQHNIKLGQCSEYRP